MRSRTDTQEQQVRRTASRDHVRSARAPAPLGAPDHVRPAGDERPGDDLKRIPQRMRPRSQRVEAVEPISISQRRAQRRTRKARSQAQASGKRRSRTIHLLSWRLVSGAMVIGLSAVLYLFLSMDAFVIASVSVGGEKYLEPGEIFRYSDIAERRIFWIDPQEVEERLEAVPNIADAEVLVRWPPDMVQIVVREREPALIWEQGVRVWVDVNGIVMRQREDRADLLRIVVPGNSEPLSVGSRIPQTLVDGALLLKKRHPNIDVLLYDPQKGLGHHHGLGWTVWFGDGKDMDTKLLVYNRLVEDIANVMQPGEIDMRDPDHPVVSVLWYIE